MHGKHHQITQQSRLHVVRGGVKRLARALGSGRTLSDVAPPALDRGSRTAGPMTCATVPLARFHNLYL
eukprot:5230573-Prymnesium_polylepis.1